MPLYDTTIDRTTFSVVVTTIEFDTSGTHYYKNIINNAVEFTWYLDKYFLVYTPTTQTFFDIDDIYSITVDGVEKDIPVT